MRLTVDQALESALPYVPLIGEEEVPLWDSLGRVLTRDIRATMQQPPFDRSPLDGYAVRGEDIRCAAPGCPAVLQVVDKLYAGAESLVPVEPGQAVRLMTGSMIPKGADCVVRQEDTDFGENQVQIYAAVQPGKNYCHCGEEYGLNDLLLTAGCKIDAAAIAVAAGAGFTLLPVRRRLRVAVVATGDEVRQPGQPLEPGKIYDSNTSYLVARLHQLGVQVTDILSVGDDLREIVTAFEKCASGVDMVLTTGGVSVGQKDLVEEAVTVFGGQVIFHGIAMKPGMPTLFAVKEGILFLGLSGNPFSAAVPFELLFRPILAKMTGDDSLSLKRGTAQADANFGKRSICQRFLRAYSQNGIVTMPREQSNGQMRSMVGCNCLIDIPAGTEKVCKGDTVDIIWL